MVANDLMGILRRRCWYELRVYDYVVNIYNTFMLFIQQNIFGGKMLWDFVKLFGRRNCVLLGGIKVGQQLRAYNGHRWGNITSGIATCQPRTMVVSHWCEKGDRYLLGLRQYDSCVRLRMADKSGERHIFSKRCAELWISNISETNSNSNLTIQKPTQLFIFNFENLHSTQASHYIFNFPFRHRINHFVRQVATLFHTCSGAHRLPHDCRPFLILLLPFSVLHKVYRNCYWLCWRSDSDNSFSTQIVFICIL